MSRTYTDTIRNLTATIYIHQDGSVTMKIRRKTTQEPIYRNLYRSEALAMKAWHRWVG